MKNRICSQSMPRTRNATILASFLLLLVSSSVVAGGFDRGDFDGADSFYGGTACASVQAEIFRIQVTALPGGDLTRRTDIRYVHGDGVDLTITTDRCSSLDSLSYGNMELGGFFDSIEGGSRYYENLGASDVSFEGNPAREIRLRIHFTNLGQGRTFPVRFGFRNNISQEYVEGGFRIVQVKGINESMRITVTENELRNEFIAGMYAKFGDYNALYECEDDDCERIAYDLSYDPLTTTNVNGNTVYSGTDLVAENGSFLVAMEFSAVLDNWCDPRVQIWGRFDFVPDGEYLVLNWVDEMQASFDFPLYCQPEVLTLAVTTSLVAAIVVGKLVNALERSAAGELQVDFEEENEDVRTCKACIVESVTIEDGVLELSIQPPYSRVRIDLPYDNLDGEHPTDWPAEFGMALPSDTHVVVTAGGMLQSCIVAGHALPGECSSHPVASNGLFNWFANMPVPSPWEEINGQIAYFEPRHEARSRIDALQRTPELLPMPSYNVAGLIARIGDWNSLDDLRYTGEGCVIRARHNRQDYLALGPNDHRDVYNSGHMYGQGTYEVTVGIPTTANQSEFLLGGNDLPLCPSDAQNDNDDTLEHTDVVQVKAAR